MRRALPLVLVVLAALSGVAFADPLRIAVISDLNGSYGSTDYAPEVPRAIAAIIARDPDLVISTGDMIAGQRASPKLSPKELAAMWAAFHATVSDPLARAGIPFLVTPGNHDASAYPGYESDRSAFVQAWSDRLPALSFQDATGWPFRIAATVKGIGLIGIDATRSGPLAADDMAWLRSRLPAPGQTTQTLILFGHLPLMPISEGREGDILADPALLDLARQGGVDLWLSGHHHALYSGTMQGILFVAQGALGNGPRRLLGRADRSPASFTWIEVAADGRITVSAFTAPDFRTALPPDDLPPTLGTAPFRLTRQFIHPG